jgi:hypothetical protein
VRRLIIVILVASTLACSSTTVINSVPDGAIVYLNGERVGPTPYTHSDKRIVGSSLRVVLKKDGYQEFSTVLRKNEDANVGAIVGGVFLAFPFLWVMGYKPTHTFELTPVAPAAP